MMRKFLIVLTGSVLLFSCTRSAEDRIVGSWRVSYRNEPAMMSRDITMNFKKDKTMSLDVSRGNGSQDHHEATYALINDGKAIQVFREGKPDRKNIAAIIELTDKSLVLVDQSEGSAGDTMRLEKIK